MGHAEQPSNIWTDAADDVLAVMLNDETARHKAIYEQRLRPVHMPSLQHVKTCEAIIATMQAGEAIHDTTILDKCGSTVSLDWLTQRMTLYDAKRADAFDSNIGIVRKHGMTNGVKRLLGTAIQQLTDGKGVDEVTQSLITVFTGLDQEHAIKRETAKEIADDFFTLMQSTPVPLLLTGLDWLDGLTGGIDKGHMWWIAAPYKSRKSTVMLNMALGLLMTWVLNGCAGDAPSIGIASGEMPRRRIAAQFVSMIAVAWLRVSGLYDATWEAKNGNKIPMNVISPTALLQARADYRRWHPKRVQAVDYGIEQFRRFDHALRVYDRSPEGGTLADVKKLISVMRRDIHRYNTNVFFIDYLQIFKGAADAKLFDYVSNASLELQRFASTHDVSLVVLAQQNEEAIKGNNNGYSAGIKGGGDPTATADYLIASRYKAGDLAGDENILELTLKFSRHGAGGGDVQHLFNIHPQSGLLLEAQWIKKMGGAG